MNTPKIPTDMRDMLMSSGLSWHIETGGSHFKLIIGNRFATILPKAPRVRMQISAKHRNAMAHIRRAIREQRA